MARYALYQYYEVGGTRPPKRVFVGNYPSVADAKLRTQEIATTWELVEVTEKVVLRSNIKTIQEKRKLVFA